MTMKSPASSMSSFSRAARYAMYWSAIRAWEFADVHFLAADQVEQQVHRAVVDVEIDFI